LVTTAYTGAGGDVAPLLAWSGEKEDKAERKERRVRGEERFGREEDRKKSSKIITFLEKSFPSIHH